MKYIEWPGNTNSCSFTYVRCREGPNKIIAYYKNSSRLFYDQGENFKHAWRVLGTAKFTSSAQELKAWLASMHEQYGEQPTDEEGRADSSFASEAMDEEEPNNNTKMIT